MRRRLIPLSCLLAALFLSSAAAAAPLDETVGILERWTSAHWGRDCFVWVVHYPGELIDPWVEAEAARSGMTEAERAEYRAKFVSELRLDTSETFLVSVYSFGARPVSLAPVRENVALITPTGGRVSPSRYDTSLENASGGVVQGLVFFPKQSGKDFSLALRGLGVQEEQIFSFHPAQERAAASLEEPEPEVVIVDLPKRKASPKAPARQTPQQPALPPAPPPSPPREILPLFREDSSDMEAFVRSLQERGDKGQERREPERDSEAQSPGDSQSRPPQNAGNAYTSRENLLRQFLGLWIDNRGAEMYDMLSEGSRKVLSRENFVKEVSRASDFRAGLKGGYRIEWVGEERARIVTDRRLLMFRSLLTRTVGVIRENSSWRIVW